MFVGIITRLFFPTAFAFDIIIIVWRGGGVSRIFIVYIQMTNFPDNITERLYDYYWKYYRFRWMKFGKPPKQHEMLRNDPRPCIIIRRLYQFLKYSGWNIEITVRDFLTTALLCIQYIRIQWLFKRIEKLQNNNSSKLVMIISEGL